MGYNLPPGVTQAMIDSAHGWDEFDEDVEVRIVLVTIYSPGGSAVARVAVMDDLDEGWTAIHMHAEDPIGVTARGAARAAAQRAAARGEDRAQVTVRAEDIAETRTTLRELLELGGVDPERIDELGPF